MGSTHGPSSILPKNCAMGQGERNRKRGPQRPKLEGAPNQRGGGTQPNAGKPQKKTRAPHLTPIHSSGGCASFSQLNGRTGSSASGFLCSSRRANFGLSRLFSSQSPLRPQEPVQMTLGPLPDDGIQKRRCQLDQGRPVESQWLEPSLPLSVSRATSSGPRPFPLQEQHTSAPDQALSLTHPLKHWVSQ